MGNSRSRWLVEDAEAEAAGDRILRHVAVDDAEWFQACRVAAMMEPDGRTFDPVRPLDAAELDQLAALPGGTVVIAETG